MIYIYIQACPRLLHVSARGWGGECHALRQECWHRPPPSRMCLPALTLTAAMPVTSRTALPVQQAIICVSVSVSACACVSVSACACVSVSVSACVLI